MNHEAAQHMAQSPLILPARPAQSRRRRRPPHLSRTCGEKQAPPKCGTQYMRMESYLWRTQSERQSCAGGRLPQDTTSVSTASVHSGKRCMLCSSRWWRAGRVAGVGVLHHAACGVWHGMATSSCPRHQQGTAGAGGVAALAPLGQARAVAAVTCSGGGRCSPGRDNPAP